MSIRQRIDDFNSRINDAVLGESSEERATNAHDFDRETGRQGNARLDDALETPGFMKFLSEFPDSEDLDMGEIGEGKILQRFEAFKKLPEVTKAVGDLLKKKIFEGFEGITISDEELKGVGEYLKAEITQKENYGFLELLSSQVKEYNRLPAEIKTLELQILGMPGREFLEEKIWRKGRELRDVEQEQSQKEGVAAGMKDVKVATDLTKNMEKNLLSAHEVLKEDTEVFKHVDGIVKAWQERQNRLAQVAKKIPQLENLAKNTELENFAAQWEHQKNQKSDSAAFKGSFERNNWQAKLEGFVKSQAGRVSRAETKLIELNQRRKKQLPGYDESLSELHNITEESRVNDKVDGELFESHGQRLDASQHIEEMIRYNEQLKQEPWNQELLRKLRERVFELTQARQLGGALSAVEADIDRLSELSNRRDYTENTHDYNQVVAHSQKNFFMKLFNNPEKKAGNRVKWLERQGDFLRTQQQEAVDLLQGLEGLEEQKQRADSQYKIAKEELFNTLGFAKEIFALARKKSEERINVLTNPDASYEQFFQAERFLTKLEINQQEDDSIDYFGKDFLVKGWTRQTLKEGIGELIFLKVSREVKKTILSLDENNVKPSDVYKKIMDIEAGLGAFGASDRYKELKVNAMKEVLKDKTVPWIKRKILERALHRSNNENNFWSFLQNNRAPATA